MAFPGQPCGRICVTVSIPIGDLVYSIPSAWSRGDSPAQANRSWMTSSLGWPKTNLSELAISIESAKRARSGSNEMIVSPFALACRRSSGGCQSVNSRRSRPRAVKEAREALKSTVWKVGGNSAAPCLRCRSLRRDSRESHRTTRVLRCCTRRTAEVRSARSTKRGPLGPLARRGHSVGLGQLCASIAGLGVSAANRASESPRSL